MVTLQYLHQKTLRDVRILRQKSQHELATDVGVSPSAITLWETGKSQPSMAHRKILGRALGLSEEEMYCIFPPRPRCERPSTAAT